MHLQKTPSPASYLDPHSFLKDIYFYRKNLDADFSYQTWAEELQLKSRSSLRLVILGQKPLTMAFSQALAINLALKGLEKEYFFLMTEHQLQEDSEKKKLLMRQMLDLLKFMNGCISHSDTGAFLSDTTIPALQVLLSFNDHPRTAESLALLLNKNIEVVEEWLMILQSLGLAQLTSAGRWESNHADFKVTEKLGSTSLKNYHAAVLRESAEAIHLPMHLRRFRTLFLSLNESQYEQFCEKLNEALSSLLAHHASSSLTGKKLYRYTMAVMPLTETFSSSSEHAKEKMPINEGTV